MKTKHRLLLIVLALIAGVHPAAAQTAQFFRMVGPAATKITALREDGTLVWTNALVGTNYTVQTVSSLPGGTNWVDYVRLPVTSGVNTNQIIAFNPPTGMALIPAGVFTMGNYLINGSSITNDPDITDANPTNDNVSAFYMDVNLVNYSQWQSVYTYATNYGYGFFQNTTFGFYQAGGKTANNPVQTVDWFDCVKWSNARSQQAGLTPVYYTDVGLTQVYTSGEPTTVYQNMANNGYRLPTEAEWEKAARGGLSGQRFPWGDTISESQANYFGSPGGYAYDLGPDGYNAIGSIGGTSPATSPVGSFAANGYGLNDMAGNVFEWCWDWYAGPTYPAGSPYLGGTDPRGPVGPLSQRVLRGGSWVSYAVNVRSAFRYRLSPGVAVNVIGFRCVRVL
jgi:sulfatase modifying factor 1